MNQSKRAQITNVTITAVWFLVLVCASEPDMKPSRTAAKAREHETMTAAQKSRPLGLLSRNLPSTHNSQLVSLALCSGSRSAQAKQGVATPLVSGLRSGLTRIIQVVVLLQVTAPGYNPSLRPILNLAPTEQALGTGVISGRGNSPDWDTAQCFTSWGERTRTSTYTCTRACAATGGTSTNRATLLNAPNGQTAA
jgi:hypothetical protein